jgi:lipopolysaccharide transport system ATP-binding protein
MDDIAIQVENLSKRYQIGELKKYKALRDSLTEAIMAPYRAVKNALNGQETQGAGKEDNYIWALKDVSFNIKRGEVVGVIGPNGAGKSTLLKILSRITEPSVGRAHVRGRVGSLLEVGTGFHPELTGRENVFLNGAILGMRKNEIERKFDEIVDFSGVEKFIDTPVKHYSSGMYVRLAFSVAAHLETEILLVDEVLAVGDAAFQKKCLGKMDDVARAGRTVLFVSHNMVAVESLCQRAVLLNEGKIEEDGHPDQVVTRYLQESYFASAQTEKVWDDLSLAPGNDKVRLHRVCVHPETGSPSERITMRTPILLEFEYWNLVPDRYIGINIHLLADQNIVAFASSTTKEPAWQGRPFPAGLFKTTCRIPGDLLNSGLHRIRLRVVERGQFILDYQDVLTFEVGDSVERRGKYYGKRAGIVRPLLDWSTEFVEDLADKKIDI